MEKDFIIATDSTCDLPEEMLRELDVACCDMLYFIDDEEYGGDTGRSVEFHDFYERMRAGAKTSTSMINDAAAQSFLSKLLEQKKDILVLCFSSALSGTYENYVRVAKELSESSGNSIRVVDSRAASAGEGLFVTLVAKKRESGASFEETVKYAEENVRHVLHYFVVSDLKYLARGGRLSKGSAFFGNLLNIKPVLHVDELGRLIPIKKVIGRKKSLRTLVEKMEERYNKESDIVYITHGDCYEDAQDIADEITQKFGITPKILPLSYVIGSHSGPGTVALFFTGDDRIEN